MTTLQNIKNSFINQSLFTTALTHRSYINENKDSNQTNERLEFLGDAVLEFVVSKEIFNKFPDKEEGYLTALRSNLVNTKNLKELALKLNLGQSLLLSKGEIEGGGRDNPSLLANSVEAIIGAIFVDQGISKAEMFIKDNILIDVDKKANSSLKDCKSILQEKVQANNFSAPKYQVVEESGPDHNKIFTVEVVINSKSIASGKGKSKSEAEQEAAFNALNNMLE